MRLHHAWDIDYKAFGGSPLHMAYGNFCKICRVQRVDIQELTYLVTCEHLHRPLMANTSIINHNANIKSFKQCLKPLGIFFDRRERR